MLKIRALALYSGGLDSILACRVVMNQGIDVQAIHFITPFFGYDKKGKEDEAKDYAAKHYGITLKVVDVGREFLGMVRHPKHGYGKNLNPCLDCKIFLISKAKEYLEKEKASFLITGEVLGQRPMSQRRDALRIVERDSNTEGILLRPLSAKHLKPTIAEEQRWVNRDTLFDFKGRGRKPQMMLAERLGVKKYPAPAGGCLLTDSHLSARFKWMFDRCPDITVEDILLTKVGRYFVLAGDALLVVGRLEAENHEIAKLSRKGDILLELSKHPGPLSLLRGPCTKETLETAAAITVRYSRVQGGEQVEVAYREEGELLAQVIRVNPISDQAIQAYMINSI
jgi:tRNA-uridine 2-sulfurtransferase